MALTSTSGGGTHPSTAGAAASLTDLVSRIRRQDPAAEEEFLARYWRGVTVIIRHACSDQALLEDVRQETFRVALEKVRAGAVRDPERLSGFIASLARNLIIQHFRRAEIRQVSRTEIADRDVVDRSPSQLQRLIVEENAAAVRQVLEELPSERDRQLLTRYYLRGEAKDEICAALALTSQHFNRVLFRARERYRELYSRRVGDAEGK